MQAEGYTHSWQYSQLDDILRLEQQEDAGYSLIITRLAPGDGRVQVDWAAPGPGPVKGRVLISCGRRNDADVEETVIELGTGSQGSVTLTGLENGADYELRLWTADGGSERQPASTVRLVRPGVVPGMVVNYIHPDDYAYGFSGRSPASPSLLRLPSGKLLASHDVYWGKAGQNLSLIFSSADDGVTWKFVTFLYPCFWGKLFLVGERLYMLGTSTEYGDLLIGRSDDEGETWTPPTVLIPGGSRETGGPHKAPVPVVIKDGRVWTAIEHGSWTLGAHDVGVISAPADSDLLDAGNWSIPPFVAYDANWPGTVEGGKPSLLEGNVVVTPEGKLVNLLRYQTKGGVPEIGRAVIMNVNAEHPEQPASFGKVVDFYGNLSKFTILFDADSGCYWSLVNRALPHQVQMRNILTLVYSTDLEHWTIAKDVLDYETNGWPEDYTKVGFQYVDWIFSDGDILYLSRTGINGAYNYHNANHITFHRIPDFRSLRGE